MIVGLSSENILRIAIDFEQRQAKADHPAFGEGQAVATPKGKLRVDHRVFVEREGEWVYFFRAVEQVPVGESGETMESLHQYRWKESDLLLLQIAAAPVSPVGEKKRRERLTGQDRIEQAFERAKLLAQWRLGEGSHAV